MKFGIFIHGVHNYSVPSYGTEWFWHNYQCKGPGDPGGKGQPNTESVKAFADKNFPAVKTDSSQYADSMRMSIPQKGCQSRMIIGLISSSLFLLVASIMACTCRLYHVQRIRRGEQGRIFLRHWGDPACEDMLLPRPIQAQQGTSLRVRESGPAQRRNRRQGPSHRRGCEGAG